MFVPGYRFVHSGSPLRGTIEAEEFSPDAWETAVDKARFPARVYSSPFLGGQRTDDSGGPHSAASPHRSGPATGTSNNAFRLADETDADQLSLVGLYVSRAPQLSLVVL